MTYELAKQLKDAGFPQKRDESEDKYFVAEDLQVEGGIISKVIYKPTLSELIEACIKDNAPFGAITIHIDNDGSAEITSQRISQDEGYIKGKTPEEAVAKLWLALNKKD